MTPFYRGDVLFEYVCTLVRAGGVQDEGWDAYLESIATLKDLKTLSDFEFPDGVLLDAQRTETRLALISYCHATEMHWPYFLLANLLRVRLGQKYDLLPFRHLEQQRNKKNTFGGWRPASPHKKIEHIKQLASAASLPNIGIALDEIYDSVIRNAVYHSDYALHSDEMRLLSSYRCSTKHKYSTQVVVMDELVGLLNNAFAFYSAFVQLYERAKTLLKDFEHAFLPFDSCYKGLLELVFEEGSLIGFRAYWPNGTLSEYTRRKTGCMATNISFNPDRSMNFFVGLYAAKPGTFSPLVENDSAPQYPPVPGTNIHPYWPAELKTYKLYDSGKSSQVFADSNP